MILAINNSDTTNYSYKGKLHRTAKLQQSSAKLVSEPISTSINLQEHKSGHLGKLINSLRTISQKFVSGFNAKNQLKLPEDFDINVHKETVNKCLAKYLENFQPISNISADDFKTLVYEGLNKYFTEEAVMAYNILHKNKTAFEELDNYYSTSLSAIAEEIRKQNMSYENAREYLISKKEPIDKEFANKVLDIFVKEYNLGEIRPEVKCERLQEGIAGGWRPIEGCIVLDSSKLAKPETIVKILFHEFTHFRQDMDIMRYCGPKNFYKSVIVRCVKTYDMDIPFKRLMPLFLMTLMSQPVYNKMEENIENNPPQKGGIEKQLAQINFVEKMNYKSSLKDGEAYHNQLSEIHAYYNGDYFEKLYKKHILLID
jgi:hypothetical protein